MTNDGAAAADQVTYALTFEEVLAAYRVAANRRTWPTVAAGAVASCLLVGGLSLEFTAPANEWVYIAVRAFLGALLWPWLWQKLVLPRKVKRLFAQQAALRSETTKSWRDEGLTWTSARASGRNDWSDYIRCLESPDILLFYLSDVMYQIMPKRALTEANMASLRPYLILIQQRKRTKASNEATSADTSIRT